ncbi:hypothetical protein Tco_0065556 [Tanacetum coccineum]
MVRLGVDREQKTAGVEMVLEGRSQVRKRSGSTTTHSDDPSPSSSPVKEFYKKMVRAKNSNVSDEPVFLNTPLSDKDECFSPEDDNDEIDDFLAMEVSSNLEEGYFDSEGDIAFLDNLLSDDDSHNLDSKFTVDLLTLPARNDRGFDGISYEPTQEEIDILLVPDDLIPPGVDDADSEDEVNESPNLDHQNDPSIPRPPPEPPDIKKCLTKAGILPTLVSDLPFISSIVSFENEDTIFDPGIVTFLRASGTF